MDIAKDKLSILDASTISFAGSLSFIQPMLPTPMTGPGTVANPVFLLNTLPTAVFASAGSTVSLSSILTNAFGTANANAYSEFWITYYGASTLSGWDFSYWNLSNKQVTKWLVNGTDIGPDFNHQHFLDSSGIGTATLKAGNDIGDLAYVMVPTAFDPGSGTPIEYQQLSIITVDPSMKSPDADNGMPTPQDIVDSAERFATAYSGTPNDNDCHKIACALSAAVGAALDDDVTYSLDPAENENNGFWRVAYRGSDPHPVTNWQTLVQPGDIVRMGWQGGGQHTTTVLSVNSNGTIQVFDNDAFSGSTEIIGIHTANYETDTIPSTITIFRLASNHFYDIVGTKTGEMLAGTDFNDHITGGGASDTLLGGKGDDYLDGGAGADILVGGAGADTLRAHGGRDKLRYDGVSDSTGSSHDKIIDFDGASTRFDLDVKVKAIDASVTSGELRTGHFDFDLAHAIGASQLAANQAVLLTPDSGNLAGHLILVVDANGQAGYQAGADYVFDITGATNIAQLSTHSFI